MIAKFSVLLFAIVLSLFFAPWAEFQTKGKPLATATGYQAIRGELAAVGNRTIPALTSPAHAPMMGAAFLIVAAATASAFAGFRKGRKPPHGIIAFLSLAGLALLVFQKLNGFPLQHKIEESLMARALEQTGFDPSAGFDSSFAYAVTMRCDVIYLPAFHAAMSLLAVPILLFAASIPSLLRTHREQRGNAITSEKS